MGEPPSGTPPSVSASEHRLDSWKEIAAYLNRDVTTVQRWEKREGMPVHRHQHDRIGSVYASRAELDTWVRSRNLRDEQEGGNNVAESNLASTAQRLAGRNSVSTRKYLLGLAVLVASLVLGAMIWFHKTGYFQRNPIADARLQTVTDFDGLKQAADKDTIVLADFTNKTGDTVFDDTLRQGLSVQLEQSPFLSLVSEQQIRQTLKMMGQKPDVKLTPEVARELCQRTGSTAVLDGSIAQFGTQYLLTLKAVSCVSGESLASTEAQASDKSHILGALGRAGSDIRSKLGESLSSVHKFDAPLQQATTSSLEALQAYSLGRKTLEGADFAAAIPLFQSAVRSDPSFAMAYANLGTAYYYTGETSLGDMNTAKAYELRDRVSQREKFYIESHYYYILTGDLEKARPILELWGKVYPREVGPHNWSAVVYQQLGLYEKSLEQALESHRLGASGASYNNLATSYTALNRLEEGRAIAKEARAKGFDSPNLRFSIYMIAFLQNDAAGMKEQVDWAVGKQPEEEWMLTAQAMTAAYYGQIRKAREFWHRARASAERRGTKETLAGYETDAAWWEAHVGNLAEARERAAAALVLSTNRDVECSAARELAMAGDAVRAQPLANDLAKRFPENTALRFSCLPTIQARIALSRNDPAGAIEFLQVAAPYELGMGVLYPAYVRGEAYLAAHRGSEAAGEFQKILDHRGIVGNAVIGALTHLQIGRAYALQGDASKAKAAYQDFLTLWKDADPDTPIFIAAKSEYAKLK